MKKTRPLVIARLINNTRTKKRPNNLSEVADDILWLENELGSLEAVSDKIGISKEMLNRFLRVKKLGPDIKRLVERRLIDSVTIVNKLYKFKEEDRKVITGNILNGELLPTDIKVLAPLRRKQPNRPIKGIINQILKSKPIKHYIIRFSVPTRVTNKDILLETFENIISKDEIVNYSVNDDVWVFEITQRGKSNVKKAAKKAGLTMRGLVERTVKDNVK